MQNIFKYVDYRKFLSDFYEHKKETTQFFSYRYFAQKAGVNSPSLLKNVIEGKRNLTGTMAEKFCKALGLRAKEKTYFLNLVFYNQAKTSNEKQQYYSALRSMSEKVQESVLKGDKVDYFSNWYVPVIREIICIKDFNDDYDAIASSLFPRIDSSQAKSAVELLLRLKLVEKTKKGIYNQVSNALIADEMVTSMAVRSFIRTMIDHSKNSLDTIGKEDRNISGITMGISKEAYNTINKEIEAFKDRLKKIVLHDNAADRVYQINLSLFPISRILQKESANSENI